MNFNTGICPKVDKKYGMYPVTTLRIIADASQINRVSLCTVLLFDHIAERYIERSGPTRFPSSILIRKCQIRTTVFIEVAIVRLHCHCRKKFSVRVFSQLYRLFPEKYCTTKNDNISNNDKYALSLALRYYRVYMYV